MEQNSQGGVYSTFLLSLLLAKLLTVKACVSCVILWSNDNVIVSFCSFTGTKENKDSWRWTFTWVYHVCDEWFRKIRPAASCGSVERPHKFWGGDLRGKKNSKGVERFMIWTHSRRFPMWTKAYMYRWGFSHVSVKDLRQLRISSFPNCLRHS